MRDPRTGAPVRRVGRGGRLVVGRPDRRARRSPHVVAASENAYRAFYAALTSTCDSARLRRYATSVRDQHARYRAATLDTIDRAALADLVDKLSTAAVGGKHKPAATAVRAEIELFAETYADLVGR